MHAAPRARKRAAGDPCIRRPGDGGALRFDCAKQFRQLRGGLHALRRLSHDHRRDQLGERSRRFTSHFADVAYLSREAGGDDRLHGIATKRWLAGQHLVQHAAEAVDVGAAIHPLFSDGLLWAHVLRRAEDDPREGETLVPLRLQHARNAEVCEQRLPGGEEDVLGLDIAVHDATRVRAFQCRRERAHDDDRLAWGKLVLPLEPVAQRLPFDERGDVVELPPRFAGVVQRQDVRMRQLGRNPYLAREPVRGQRLRELVTQDLDGDVAVVPEVAGAVHIGRGAASDDFEQLIASAEISAGERGSIHRRLLLLRLQCEADHLADGGPQRAEFRL